MSDLHDQGMATRRARLRHADLAARPRPDLLDRLALAWPRAQAGQKAIRLVGVVGVQPALERLADQLARRELEPHLRRGVGAWAGRVKAQALIMAGQVDLDGRANYSPVVQVTWEVSITGVYPNPTTGAVQINSAAPWQKVLLKNNLGQLVKTMLPGQETTLQGLENGIYQLEVYGKEEGAPAVFKVVKH